jgi:hypothetical protein
MRLHKEVSIQGSSMTVILPLLRVLGDTQVPGLPLLEARFTLAQEELLIK